MLAIQPGLDAVEVESPAEHPLFEVLNTVTTRVASVATPQLFCRLRQQFLLLVGILLGRHLVADLVKEVAPAWPLLGASVWLL